MLWESVCVLGYFLLLTLFGVGHSLLLLAKCKRSTIFALAVSPTLGFCILTLLGFPLVRYFGPVNCWSRVLAAVLLLASLASLRCWRHNRRCSAYFGKSLYAMMTATSLVFIFSCYQIYNAGIQGCIFRANPSDAFVYMTMSEGVRTCPWKLLVEGGNFQARKSTHELAKQCPSALFSARFLRIPVRVSMMVSLAFGASIFQIETQRFYYLFGILCLALTVQLAFAWCQLLGMKSWQSAICAVTSAIGFWPRISMEIDSPALLSAVPVVMALLLSVAKLSTRLVSKQLIGVTSILAASLCMLYFEIVPIIALVTFFYLLSLSLRQRRVPHLVGKLALVVVLLILSLALTGQIDYLIANQIGIWKLASNSKTWSHSLQYLFSSIPVEALTGWSALSALVKKDSALSPAVNFACVLAYATSIFCFLGLVVTVMRFRTRVEVLTISVVISTLGIGILLALKREWYFAIKCFLVFIPFIPIVFGFGVTTAFHRLRVPTLRHALTVSGSVLFGSWIFSQFFYAAECLKLDTMRDITLISKSIPMSGKREDYESKRVRRELEKISPSNLLVYVTERDGIGFPLYCEFVFQKFKPYYQYGLIFDNETNTYEYDFQQLHKLPDYAVISPFDDYIGRGNLGVELLRSPSLVLYKITAKDKAMFERHKPKVNKDNLFDTSDLDGN